jgi:DNA-binding GntR family transcriptional regulator
MTARAAACCRATQLNQSFRSITGNIVSALRKHDGVMACDIAAAHIDTLGEALLRYSVERPEYFVD